MSGALVARICQREGCGKHYRVEPSVITKGEGKYCSRSCSAIDRSAMQRDALEAMNRLEDLVHRCHAQGYTPTVADLLIVKGARHFLAAQPPSISPRSTA